MIVENIFIKLYKKNYSNHVRVLTCISIFACCFSALIFTSCEPDVFPSKADEIVMEAAFYNSETFDVSYSKIYSPKDSIAFGILCNEPNKLKEAKSILWEIKQGENSQNFSQAKVKTVWEYSGKSKIYLELIDSLNSVFRDSLEIIINSKPIFDTTKISPINNSDSVKYNSSQGIKFTWSVEDNDFQDELIFNFTLAKDKDFQEVIFQDEIKKQYYYLDETLETTTTYWWKIIAKDLYSASDSSIASFTTISNNDLITTIIGDENE